MDKSLKLAVRKVVREAHNTLRASPLDATALTAALIRIRTLLLGKISEPHGLMSDILKQSGGEPERPLAHGSHDAGILSDYHATRIEPMSPAGDISMEQNVHTPMAISFATVEPGDLPFLEADLNCCHAEFMASHFRQWLELLLSKFSVEFIEMLPRGQAHFLVDVFFLEGDPAEAFSVLVHAISASSAGYQRNKCISLLEAFLRDHQMAALLWNQSQAKCSQSGRAGKVDHYTQQQWHDLLTLVVTVPERITNKLQQETSELFYPDHYVPLLVLDLLTALQRVHNSLKSSRECSVTFLGQLLGKLCLSGYGERVWTSLLMPRATALMREDFVWCRVFETLINRVPDMMLEATITPVLLTATGYGTIDKLLGNNVLTSNKLNYLLTNKLLLLRHFPQDSILQNIIGHLASSPTRRHLHTELLVNLMEVWADPGAIRHTSYDQHFYICRAILIALAFLDSKAATSVASKLTDILLRGTQHHLESAAPRVRRLGMVIAEQVSLRVNPAAGEKLQFEYEKDSEVARLISLLTPPEAEIADANEVTMNDITTPLERLEVKSSTEKQLRSASVSTTAGKSNDDSDLDSDDDLEPYDLSNDTKVCKVKPPVYVRDCMEGLLSSDNPEKVEVCLMVAEKLIRQNPSTVDELFLMHFELYAQVYRVGSPFLVKRYQVAVEFTRLLLHLQNNAAFPAFRVWQHGAMVALAVSSPAQVADYLTKQFYDRNYNIRQRMDMLEVLSAAARELSAPKVPDVAPSPLVAIMPQLSSEEEEPHSWQQVVQKRIDSKTRRFVKGCHGPKLPEVANRFASVAGHFFFPLLKQFDRPEVTLDLLGDDHLVLSRLIYTLGVVVHAATNAPIARQMGTSLLEFVLVVRFHPQPSVRQAALFAVSMVILALPGFVLVTHLQQEIGEAKSWLEGVIKDDVDKECQKMALQALVLLEKALHEEFGGLKPVDRQ